MKRRILFAAGFCLIVGLISSCATSQPAKTEPPPPVSYNFDFTPPEKVAKKCGITIGIVSPHWDQNIGYGQSKTPWFDAGISPNPKELLQYPDLTAHAFPPPTNVIDIYMDFHKNVKKDFEGIMIARGFDIMGPFDNVDEMTYPQKKSCNLIMVPEFSQVIRSTPTTINLDLIEGTAVVRSEVSLNVYEPLSKEKLWTKKFSHVSEPLPYKATFDYDYVYQNDKKVGVQRKGIIWDNRAANFAKAEEAFFKEVMQKSWNYFSVEEMTVLKEHADELRKMKRF